MKNTYAIILRWVLYTGLLVCLGGILNYIASFENISEFKEGGIVEWMQFSLLGISAAIFLWTAGKNYPQKRVFPIVAATLIGIAMVRESDALLNYYMPVTGWKLPAFILCIFLLFTVFYKRHVFFYEFGTVLFTHFFALMWAGLLLVIYGQMIGHGDFLEPLLQADYIRDFKRLMEECFEMLGYFLIFVGSIEFWLEAKLKKKSCQ